MYSTWPTPAHERPETPINPRGADVVKVNGPLMSMDASGSVAGAITFSKWKGRNYVRQRVVPTNPKTALQVSVRAMMSFLAQQWAGLGASPKASWAEVASDASISPFNAFVSQNLQRWREFSAPGQTLPVAETGTAPVATLDSATGGPSYCDVALTVTTANDVWGVILFRSPTGSFTTSRANAVAVLPVTAAGAIIYTDSDLDPGAYYYDARFFTKEGVLGAEEGEVTGTAT